MLYQIFGFPVPDDFDMHGTEPGIVFKDTQVGFHEGFERLQRDDIRWFGILYCAYGNELFHRKIFSDRIDADVRDVLSLYYELAHSGVLQGLDFPEPDWYLVDTNAGRKI